MKIRRSNRQTIFDVAIQYCGDAEAAFEIARINDVSLIDTSVFELELPPVYNKRIVEYYTTNNIHPATASKINEEEIISMLGEPLLTINTNQSITTING